ncbi:MAG: hypothetical protein ABIP74_04630 [Candidatus Saccharimonas sp.]
MSRWYQIVSPGEAHPRWQGDEKPSEEEVDEIVGEWKSGLEPMEIPQIVTDYLFIQRSTLWGWKTIETIHLLDSLEAKSNE